MNNGQFQNRRWNIPFKKFRRLSVKIGIVRVPSTYKYYLFRMKYESGYNTYILNTFGLHLTETLDNFDNFLNIEIIMSSIGKNDYLIITCIHVGYT